MNTIGKTLQLLSVEDSEDDLELVRNELTESGFTVMHQRVETAEALRAALERNTWDIVICDHNMPALDSLLALRIVRAADEDVPFVIVSGVIRDELAAEVMFHGACDFISKDNLSRLAAVVGREIKGAMLRADLRAAQESLHRVSHFDSLTGLPNREHLFRHLHSMMSGAGGGDAFAVFLIDLNRFRQITQSLGIVAGNDVLAETSLRLRAAIGEGNFLARLGADRFVAVLPKISSEGRAGEVATAIRQRMDEIFQINGQELFVKTSVGVSFYPHDGQCVDDLFRNAESALYSAKEAGGGSYKAYRPEMGGKGKELLIMESALYHALEHQEFELHYQPQYDLYSGMAIGTEALIRWRSPGNGLVPPGRFIPILEETGLIVPVGEWVLRAACAQNRQWQDAGMPPVCMAVNLSVIQFRQPGLAGTIRKILDETGLAPEYLELEITENIAMHAEEAAIATLHELRAIGIRIAIDDFGTGYSSLSYLKRFPIDKLKIDQSFVRDHKEGVNDDGIVKAIISMGHSLNLKVIAEGVETQEQNDFLMLHGCDEVQGYFYGKPMEAPAFAHLMGLAVSGGRLHGQPHRHCIFFDDAAQESEGVAQRINKGSFACETGFNTASLP